MKIRWLQSLILKLVPTIGASYSALVYRTTRLHIIAPEGLRSRQRLMKWEKGVIYCLWHSRFFYFGHFAKGTHSLPMISASKDGDVITKIIAKLGITAIRGSSSKQGQLALYQMAALLENNIQVAITPDGPRGPKETMKPGIIRLAQMTGRPILPASFSTTRGIFFPSWDRFLVPLPWGKAYLVVGEPVYVPKELTEEEFEKIQCSLQETMSKLTSEADRRCGRDPERQALFFLRRKRKDK